MFPASLLQPDQNRSLKGWRERAREAGEFFLGCNRPRQAPGVRGGSPWIGSGRTPSGTANLPKAKDQKTGTGSRGLHAEQHFEYHRHLKPGDVLTAENKPGKTWEKESKRAGKLHFSETVTEYRDQNGELVITARGVGVRTERPVDQ